MEQFDKGPATINVSRYPAGIILGTGTVLGLGSLAYRFLEYLYPVVPPIQLVEVPAGKPEDMCIV